MLCAASQIIQDQNLEDETVERNLTNVFKEDKYNRLRIGH